VQENTSAVNVENILMTLLGTIFENRHFSIEGLCRFCV